MAIYEITKDQIREVSGTSFGKVGVRERTGLQRLLREQIQIVSPDTLVIAEEFGEWEDSRRRIDLLGGRFQRRAPGVFNLGDHPERSEATKGFLH
jgi:hypothetical protein